MLTRDLADQFSSEDIESGGQLFARGAVQARGGSQGSVIAIVNDGALRLVTLRPGPDGRLAQECTCTAFVHAASCAHAWATLLAAEAGGFLVGTRAPRPPLRLVSNDVVDAEIVPAFPARRPPSRRMHWREAVARIDRLAHSPGVAPRSPLSSRQHIQYVLDVPSSRELGALILAARVRKRRKDGTLSEPMKPSLCHGEIAGLPDDVDRHVFGALCGALSGTVYSITYAASERVAAEWRMAPRVHEQLLARIAAAGRLFLCADEDDDDPSVQVAWDDGPPWEAGVSVVPEKGGFRIETFLARGQERLAATDLFLVAPGFAILPGPRLAPLGGDAVAIGWLILERVSGAPHVPSSEAAAAAADLVSRADIPQLELPPDLAFTRIASAPGVRLDVKPLSAEDPTPIATLSFDYEGRVVADAGQAQRIVDAERREVLERDRAAEDAARNLLRALGLRRPRVSGPWTASASRLPAVIAACLRAGWRVTIEDKRYRSPATPSLSVVSGIDWFEVRGDVSFGDVSASLPEILRAARRSERTIVLRDGSLGTLPEEWLARNAPWLGLGEADDDCFRFRPSQASFLDALLMELPEARCDETFALMRQRLRSFDGIAPDAQPEGFQGTLRDYQLQGVAWMGFLREFGLGGCLADDMGVGKTAQVLAMLESRRAQAQRSARRPSLVVVPRSLVFNWLDEAARFTPKLKVADLSGPNRDYHRLRRADAGLITYGTLRRDAELLKDLQLDYAILDEAQAIKNAGSAAAKAARLLKAHHRLAITGTPVENHLGELWSLFEFLNPGMLGSVRAFRPAAGARQELDDGARALLARALKPFLLRRTKQQVAKELPERTEQEIHCEMSPAQRKHYAEVRDLYRSQVLGRIENEGMSKAGMFVLEALLRLRQIACHPGLVDPARRGEASGKLDMLMERLEQVLDEGHKALVFSQFTTFLDIVREKLEERGVAFEYLDGKTQDRAARVASFQRDEGKRVFLISLKAGGVGLNLTAADYVFLLDPWWNPAVEAQAIDRTHRIGQTEHVFAYRLVSSDTVEERVLELQARKRALADAVLGADASLMGRMTREDIELLLS